MSGIAGELSVVKQAFDQPTLTLLHRQHAPVVIAIFRTVFGRDLKAVPAARLHEQVGAYLDELRQDGHTNVPSGIGRDICLDAMHKQWLVREHDDAGEETYTLTSHAQTALSLVRDLTRERANLSEHRVNTILGAVRRFNAEANPDRAARVRILDEEIKSRTKERDRLLSGGAIPQVSADYMLEGYSEILQLVTDLPRDFARVEEAFTSLRHHILASLQTKARVGEVIDEYLERLDELMVSTPEGRAFEGAFALLRDSALLLQLRTDLEELLAHPMAQDILTASDRKDLAGTVALIRAGLAQAIGQRQRVTRTLRDFIVTNDITRDRELDTVLRDLDVAVTAWMKDAGPRTVLPMQPLPERSEVVHLRERLWDPSADAVPPPLPAPDDDGAEVSLSAAELRAHGGPTLAALRTALQDARDDGTLASLGALFDSLDASLRRPVEVLGLLQLAAHTEDLITHEDHELYGTIRPDGSTRALHVPRVAPKSPPQEPPLGTPARTLPGATSQDEQHAGAEEPDRSDAAAQGTPGDVRADDLLDALPAAQGPHALGHSNGGT